MSKVQIIVIASALLLFGVLLFANTKMPAKAVETASVQNSSAGIEKTINDSRAGLSNSQNQSLIELEKQAQSASGNLKLILFDSLAKVCYNFKKPDLAARYKEDAALSINNAEVWYGAGTAYYTAARFVSEGERPSFYAKAIDCLEQSLSKDEKNLKTKTALGVAYVEGSSQPMKGITMLKEVVSADSNNIEAHINLGLFAEKSGQTEKAIDRFNKILTIDPTYIEAYLHLADAYEQTGNKKSAIESLEKYLEHTDDVTIKSEVQNYINKLKNS